MKKYTYIVLFLMLCNTYFISDASVVASATRRSLPALERLVASAAGANISGSTIPSFSLDGQQRRSFLTSRDFKDLNRAQDQSYREIIVTSSLDDSKKFQEYIRKS